MSKSYVQYEAEDRRLALLRILEEAKGCEANEEIIALMLRELGKRATRNEVRADFLWLKEYGLITIEEIVELQMATLTQRGQEFLLGMIIVSGIKPPLPR